MIFITDVKAERVGGKIDGFIAIGVTDLEKLGFKVNPTTGELEPTEILG